MRRKLLITTSVVLIMATLVGCGFNRKAVTPNTNNGIIDKIVPTENESVTESVTQANVETTTAEPNLAKFSNSTKYSQEIRYTITYNADKVRLVSIPLGTSMTTSDCVIKAEEKITEENKQSFPYFGVTTYEPKKACETQFSYIKKQKNYKVCESGEMTANGKTGYYMISEYDMPRQNGYETYRSFACAVAVSDDRAVEVWGNADYVTKECNMTIKEFMEAVYVDIEVYN